MMRVSSPSGLPTPPAMLTPRQPVASGCRVTGRIPPALLPLLPHRPRCWTPEAQGATDRYLFTYLLPAYKYKMRNE